MKKKAFFLCLIIWIPTLILLGCEKGKVHSTPSDEKQKVDDKTATSSITSKEIEKNLPIPIEKGEFDKIYGWLENNIILYTTKLKQHYYIYTYNLKEGRNTLLATLDSVIDSIHISGQGKYVLVRSSEAPTESHLTILDRKGNSVFFEKLQAYDMEIKWNPSYENKLLISTFSMDWFPNNYILSMKEKTLQEIELSNPFAHWGNKQELLYLSSDEEGVPNSQELIRKNLVNGNEKIILSKLYQFDTFKDMVMTVKVENHSIMYDFYSQDLKLIYSLSTPNLSNTEWLIPYYDYAEKNSDFFTFLPVSTKDFVKEDNNSFQLVSYKLESNKKKVIMENINNQPISCSSNGELCLYGYYFENLIVTNDKRINPLVSM